MCSNKIKRKLRNVYKFLDISRCIIRELNINCTTNHLIRQKLNQQTGG